MVPDLNGCIEVMGSASREDDSNLSASLPGHHFDDTLAHRIGHSGHAKLRRGRKYPWGDPAVSMPQPVRRRILIEVSTRIASLGAGSPADEASADVGNEDPASRRRRGSQWQGLPRGASMLSWSTLSYGRSVVATRIPSRRCLPRTRTPPAAAQERSRGTSGGITRAAACSAIGKSPGPAQSS